MSFIHLHLHTDYSLLDGFGMVEEYVNKCIEFEMEYFCVTDHGMGAAIPRQIEVCKEKNIIPIFGSELYVNNFHHLVPQFSDLDDDMKLKVRKNNHLLIIAKNNIGYNNLINLISSGWIDGFYYRPRVSFEKIKDNHEGLICTTACIGSEFNRMIFDENYKDLDVLIKNYKDVFGDDFYWELELHDMKEQKLANKIGLKIAEKYNIQLIVTNDVHYCEADDAENQNLMINLDRYSSSSNKNFDFHTDQLWFKSENEMDESWDKFHKDIIPFDLYTEAKNNTIKICKSCLVDVDTSPKFPQIDNDKELLLKYCMEGMKKRNLINDNIYKERLKREYKLICDKGYESYFLIVKNVVDFCKKNNHAVGPGRGSAAGSLLSYLLGITQVDPIKHGLIFERFLNPARGGKFAKLQFSKKSQLK